MNPSEHPISPRTEETEAELIARLGQRRGELLQAADVLRRPLRTVNRADNVIRKVIPILPYAITAITVITVAGSLLRGRRVRPTILIAAGLDMWRLWKTFKANSTPSMLVAERSRLSNGGSSK